MRAALSLLLLAIATPARADAPSGDPGRGRYLFAPSAFLLHGGEAVVSQREFLLSSATLGFADHVEVSLGSAVPVLSALGTTNAFNVAFGAKGGLAVADRIRVAAGFESLSFAGRALGWGFAVATAGTERVNVSVGAGLPATVVAGSPAFASPIVFLAGTLGLGRYVALASENWWIPGLPELSMVNAGMVRLTAWRMSLGLGLVRIPALTFPVTGALPWVDLSVRIGR